MKGELQMKINDLSNLDNLDRIKITHDDMKRLFEWKENNKDLVRNFRRVLESGLIQIDDIHHEVFFDDGEQVLYNIFIKKDNRLDKVHTLLWNKKTKMGYTYFSRLDLNETELNNYNNDIITLHTSLMAYMEHFSNDKQYINSTKEYYRAIANDSSSQKASKKRNKVKLSRKVYSVNVANSERIKRKYTRRTEGWTVRGFWRTYKSGKRVWIEPYQKGNKAKVTKKDYKVY
jgi:hypothetical protein